MGPNISFYPIFVPLLHIHLQYMKIDNEACPQKCRYIQYLSFVTLVNVLDAICVSVQKFFFFMIFSSRSSEHEQKPKRFFRQNKTKSAWQVSSLLDLPYIQTNSTKFIAKATAQQWYCNKLHFSMIFMQNSLSWGSK